MHYARGLRTVVLCAVLAAGAGCGDNEIGSTTGYPKDDTLRLNQLQALGTHNTCVPVPNP